MKRSCESCGKMEEEHCDFVPGLKFPDGCVCEPMGWFEAEAVPKICDDYEKTDYDEECCNCEHAEGCHKGN